MNAAVHVDTFVRDHLPPVAQWPEFLFELPTLRYPARLNCAVELLDRNADAWPAAPAIRTDDMRLVGVHVLGELATEVVHVGLIAMLAEGTIDLFNRACFNYPTLGDLYKYATYVALLSRAGIVPGADTPPRDRAG